ncbi:putative F-box/LRR-repeat protein At3g18150 [Silene latifolia]|uniref:putative F-box/LRR-repeat protein At3g18150 n=1 Tax=Silene latifolia TaxID=37657 RepID=UPI003D76F508
MSFLSKSWRMFWTQIPTVDLSLSDHYLNTDWMKAGIIRMRELFYDFIDIALESLLVVEKFKLCVPCYVSELQPRVDKWVERAFGYQLKEFEFSCQSYVLPKIVFGSALIRKVTLRDCKVNKSCLKDIHLPSLYYLCLRSVNINEQAMGKILANCPNLEDFILDICDGLERLEILGCEKLKKVNIIKYCKKPLPIKISARNLLELHYSVRPNYYDEEGVCKIELIGCTIMKKLRAIGAALDDLDLHSLLENLPGLETLELDGCNRLQHVEISSLELVHLAFRRCELLKTADVNAPNLKFFDYKGVNPIQFPPRDLTPRLKDSTIHLRCWIKSNKWYDNLVKFLAMLRHCERLTLYVLSTEDLVIPKRTRKKTKPPISGVKHFMVKLDTTAYRQFIDVDFIDALLWLAPCPQTISISDYQSRIYKSFQFEYETPLKYQETCGCWNSLPIHCWRHSLNKVSIEVKKTAKDDIELPTFFQKAKFDGKIVECSVLN